MTVFWLCPKPTDPQGQVIPTGGVWFIHRLAHLLNQAGVRSRVLQTEPFEVWWDAHPVPDYIADSGETPTAGDTLVVPEVLYPAVVPPGVREIMFVQNRQWLVEEITRYNLRPETLVCSQYLRTYLRSHYSIQALGKLTPFLDEDVWAPTGKQKDRVLLVARRYPEWPAMLAQLAAAGYPVTLVDRPVSQRQLAEALAEAEFYVHLVSPEGFPMACLEAMRMGTIVVGTTGYGGTEFMFNNETAMVVLDPEQGRYTQAEFQAEIVRKLRYLSGQAELRARLWQQAYAWSQRYTAAATTAELLGVFG